MFSPIRWDRRRRNLLPSLPLLMLLPAFLMLMPTGAGAQERAEETRADDATSSLRFTGELVQGGLTQSSAPATSLAGTSATIGGALGVRLNDRVTLRGSVLFAESDLNGAPGSPFVGRTADLWYYDAEVLVDLPVTVLDERIAPYVIGGVGARTFDIGGIGTETDIAGAFGAGVELKVDRNDVWAISVEVRDFVSPFDRRGVSTLQHDLMWTIGLRYAL